MVTDAISDLIIALKNANTAGKKTVSASYTKLKENVLAVLKKEGYIADFSVSGEGVKKTITATLTYKEGQPAITDVRRVSKFSKRVYAGAKNIRQVRNGYGKMIITTPQGIMTGDDARKQNIGGETLFAIW